MVQMKHVFEAQLAACANSRTRHGPYITLCMLFCRILSALLAIERSLLHLIPIYIRQPTQPDAMLVRAPKSFVVADLAIPPSCVAAGALHSKTKNILSRDIGTWEVNTAFQSKHIEFGDWITLFTLCLAPVIAHLLSGVPEPST
jgi:hypothetical protein